MADVAFQWIKGENVTIVIGVKVTIFHINKKASASLPVVFTSNTSPVRGEPRRDRESKGERERESVCVSVCVRVCVRERERERKALRF